MDTKQRKQVRSCTTRCKHKVRSLITFVLSLYPDQFSAACHKIRHTLILDNPATPVYDCFNQSLRQGSRFNLELISLQNSPSQFL
ncbi:hypothetical protein CDEF62S_02522 [Castellaniella defragrans]